MSIISHSLGELEHTYAGHNHLKLTTHGNIALSYPDPIHSSLSTSSSSVEELVSSRTWIASGNSFEINFVVLLHGVGIDDGSIPEHEENLGLMLRNGEVPLHPLILR